MHNRIRRLLSSADIRIELMIFCLELISFVVQRETGWMKSLLTLETAVGCVLGPLSLHHQVA
jgi:hypothetical protein